MRQLARMGWAVGAFVLLAGCGTTLSAAGQKVRLVEQAPADCQQLGAVHASATGGMGEEANTDAARIELRNQAGEMGGNVVFVESEKQKGLLLELSGVAFQCSAASPAAP